MDVKEERAREIKDRAIKNMQSKEQKENDWKK